MVRSAREFDPKSVVHGGRQTSAGGAAARREPNGELAFRLLALVGVCISADAALAGDSAALARSLAQLRVKRRQHH